MSILVKHRGPWIRLFPSVVDSLYRSPYFPTCSGLFLASEAGHSSRRCGWCGLVEALHPVERVAVVLGES